MWWIKKIECVGVVLRMSRSRGTRRDEARSKRSWFRRRWICLWNSKYIFVVFINKIEY